MTMRHRHPLATSFTIVVTGAALIASVSLGVAPLLATAAAPGTTSWTVYHGNATGTGVTSALRSVDTTKRAWTSPALSGEIYGEPLVYSGEVFVATESDTVYALSATR